MWKILWKTCDKDVQNCAPILLPAAKNRCFCEVTTIWCCGKPD